MSPALAAILALLFYAIPYVLLAAGGRSAGDAIAARLREFITPAEAVKVAVEVEPPIRVAGGELDRLSVDIASGTLGGVLPVEALSFEASGIRFDTGAMLFRREIVLGSPLEASASLLLSEQGLTAFLRSDAVRERLRGIAAPRGVGLPGLGLQPTLDIVPSGASIAGGRVEVKGQVRVQGLGLVLPLAISARPVLLDPSHFTFAEPRVLMMGRTIGAEQFEKMGGIPVIDLDALATGDVRVRVTELDLDGGKLSLKANAVLSRIPRFDAAALGPRRPLQ